MKFEKCLICPAIKEKRCSGPKFMRAPTKDLVEWLTAYQKMNGITNAQLAAASGIPKGTIDGLKNRADVRHETFLPLLKAAIEMTGGVWDIDACPLVPDDEKASDSQQEIHRLTQELEQMEQRLAKRERTIKERTRAIYALFGLCAGMILLLMLFHL